MLHNLGICCQEFIRLFLPNLDINEWKNIPEKCYKEGEMEDLTPRQRHVGWTNLSPIAEIRPDSTQGERVG